MWQGRKPDANESDKSVHLEHWPCALSHHGVSFSPIQVAECFGSNNIHKGRNLSSFSYFAYSLQANYVDRVTAAGRRS
jgi:hypothetical protein